MNQGWQCPVCRTVNAPWVCKCPNCGPKPSEIVVNPYLGVPNNSFDIVLTIHENVCKDPS